MGREEGWRGGRSVGRGAEGIRIGKRMEWVKERGKEGTDFERSGEEGGKGGGVDED